MKIKALISFAGVISMHRGQVLECDDNTTYQDLLQAGYVEMAEPVAVEIAQQNETVEPPIQEKTVEIPAATEPTVPAPAIVQESPESLENSKRK